MAEVKTKPTKASVRKFIEAVPSDTKRRDSKALITLMQRLAGEKPVMWGPTMIGFGQYHYKYDSGHEGDCFRIGFSPRKAALTLYVMTGFERYPALMKRLGKYRAGKSCLYVNKLEDIDLGVLEQMIKVSLAEMKQKHKAK